MSNLVMDLDLDTCLFHGYLWIIFSVDHPSDPIWFLPPVSWLWDRCAPDKNPLGWSKRSSLRFLYFCTYTFVWSIFWFIMVYLYDKVYIIYTYVYIYTYTYVWNDIHILLLYILYNVCVKAHCVLYKYVCWEMRSKLTMIKFSSFLLLFYCCSTNSNGVFPR